MLSQSASLARVTTRLLLALVLATAFDAAVARPRPREEKKGHKQPGYPEEYVRWRESFYRDETGKVDPARMQQAREAAKKMPLNPGLLPAVKRSAGETDALISPGNWEWRGPGNVGGRVRTLVIHPTQTNRIWIGSVAGGIWYSSDSGASWAPVDDFMANLAVCTLIIDPDRPHEMYAGTGEGYFNNDSIRGAGIFKSIDGGVTWNHLPSTSSKDFTWVNRLAISNGCLLAATANGIMRSSDRGATWTKPLSGLVAITQVEWDPHQPMAAVATGFSGLAYRSTNNGVTWAPAAGLGPYSGTRAGRVEFAFARSTPGLVYAAYWTGLTAELYKSLDGGRTYTKVAINGALNWMGGQGWYDNAIWVDPSNANTLIVGGIDLFRSTDGGLNFTKISDWTQVPVSPHADQHGIFADPGYNGVTNKRVYFTNDGGVYRTDNVHTAATRSGWQELNNNLGITQFFGAAGNPDTMTIVGGAQDNGTLRYRPLTGTEGFSQMEGGDGGYCAADQTDPNYFYAEYIYAQILRSTDGGRSTESDIWTGITEAGSSAGAEFIAPFILDPNQQSRMLVGAKSLWRSDDVKAETPSWRAIKPPIGTSRPDNITAVGVAPGNSNTVWVGHGNGGVYKTENGTALDPTWSKVDDNGATVLPDRRVGRVVVDPTNSQRVYVCFGGYSNEAFNYGGTNLWRTDDGGATWASVSGNLPRVPIFSLVIRPDNPNVLYIGTDVGVFGTEDGGATWSTTNVGPSNVSTPEVLFVGQHLVACTHGRGLFTVPVLPPSNDTTAPVVTITPDETVTNASPLIFRFEFSEPIADFTQSDIVLNGAKAAEFSGSGSVYFLRVIPAAEGSVSVSIPAAACTDTSGNTLAAAAQASVTYNSSQPFVYSTGFDGPAAPRGWRVFEGQWEWGNPVKPGGPGSDRSGTGSAFGTRLDVDYDESAYAILTTPQFTIPANAANPYKLRFWMWLAAEEGYDGGHLQVSVDGGPFHLLPASALTTAYNATVVSGLIHQPGYTGTDTFNSWRRVRANLAAYAGRTVQFRFVFGSDIFENGAGWFIDDFAIEQDPIISLAATTPIAHEGGADGRFTFLINPSAPEARTVNYTIGGSAVPGTSYAALSGSAILEPGANALQLPISVIDDNSGALRNETVTLALGEGVDYAVGSPTNALVVIIGSGRYDQWRSEHFTAAQIADNSISGLNASPSGDGVSNLLKHALGLNPHQSSAAQLPTAEFVEIAGLRYQQLRVVTPSNTSASYVGQVSADLAAWSSEPQDVETIVQPETPAVGKTTRLFRDRTPTTSGRRFIRLQVNLDTSTAPAITHSTTSR